jgi:hypothetical protein
MSYFASDLRGVCPRPLRILVLRLPAVVLHSFGRRLGPEITGSPTAWMLGARMDDRFKPGSKGCAARR